MSSAKAHHHIRNKRGSPASWRGNNNGSNNNKARRKGKYGAAESHHQAGANGHPSQRGGTGGPSGGAAAKKIGPSRTRAIPGYNPEKKSYGNFKSQPFAPQQGRMAASPKPAMAPANQANGMYAHDCAYDFEGPQCQPIQPQQPAQPNWLQAPPMGFLTPEQLGQETARNRPAITVKSPYARSSNSLSPGHSSSSGSINRSRAGESGPAPTKLLGIDWYWWAAVAGGFVLLIVFIIVFFFFHKRRRARRKKQRDKQQLDAELKKAEAQAQRLENMGNTGSSSTQQNSYTSGSFTSSNLSSDVATMGGKGGKKKQKTLAEFIAETDGNVVSSKGKVPVDKGSTIPFNPDSIGTAVPLNAPIEIKQPNGFPNSKTLTLQGKNVIPNINYMHHSDSFKDTHRHPANTSQTLPPSHHIQHGISRQSLPDSGYSGPNHLTLARHEQVFDGEYATVHPNPRAVRTLRRPPPGESVPFSPGNSDMYDDLTVPTLVEAGGGCQNGGFSMAGHAVLQGGHASMPVTGVSYDNVRHGAQQNLHGKLKGTATLPAGYF